MSHTAQPLGTVPRKRSSLDGDWSIFRQEIAYGAKTFTENMDLSPFARKGESPIFAARTPILS